MIVLYGSLLLAGILFVLIEVTVIQRKGSLSLKTTMVVAMGIAMILSLLIGTVLAIWWKQMTWPTIIAVCGGMLVGLLSGLPVGMIPALEGLFAGLMGGAMGPMLGVMVEQPMVMIYFLDGLSVVLTVVLWILIRYQKRGQQAKRQPHV